MLTFWIVMVILIGALQYVTRPASRTRFLFPSDAR